MDLIDGGGEPLDDGGHQLGDGQVGDALLDCGGPVGEVFLGGELVGCAQSVCGRGGGRVPWFWCVRIPITLHEKKLNYK